MTESSRSAAEALPVSRGLLASVAVALLLSLATPARADDAPKTIKIVAAENFYGDVAQQLAGPHATVSSILSNPDQDPHLFEASPSVARDLSGAQLVIYNGADYDPWMEKLLSAARSPDRKVVVAAEETHRKAGQNPHLWYDPATMPAVARAISAKLAAIDPADKADYDQRLKDFLAQTQKIGARVAELKHKYSGMPVTATEPVFGYMASALGLEMHNERFQRAVMNDSEPNPSDVAAFESDLRNKRPKLFIYNSQASDAPAKRLLALAQQNKIPVLGVTETEPGDKNFQQWMLAELDALDQAMSRKGP